MTLPKILRLPVAILGLVTKALEFFLFKLMNVYDTLVYSPLQTTLHPVVCKVPRTITVNSKTYTIFTANIVSYVRTLLVIPTAYCLKYQYFITAFLLVIVHDFLDHLDGIVAKAHRQLFGQIDDPLLGGFMDAFCDKIVNVLALWSVLMVTDFGDFSRTETMLYFGTCGIIITYEFILGVVRVQDFFRAYYERKYKLSEKGDSSVSIAAVMEGKLKEKLESVGIACLCLAQANPSAIQSYSGIVGVSCLLLSIRLAHASLQHKLNSRAKSQLVDKYDHRPTTVPSPRIDSDKDADRQITNHNMDSDKDTNRLQYDNKNKKVSQTLSEEEKSDALKTETEHEKEEKEYNNKIRTGSGTNFSDVVKKQSRNMLRRSVSSLQLDSRVDRVYTIGCFDLFHHGHVKLLERMRNLGKEVIVGVHDSRSILKLKSKVPIDSTERRMSNVKQHADIVYCVAGTDPTTFLACIANTNANLTSMYVRGDDMENFPARELCESIMEIRFLPYSQGVSSTKLRKEQYNSSRFGPHVQDDGHAMLY